MVESTRNSRTEDRFREICEHYARKQAANNARMAAMKDQTGSLEESKTKVKTLEREMLNCWLHQELDSTRPSTVSGFLDPKLWEHIKLDVPKFDGLNAEDWVFSI